ncbi:MAG: 1-acyl-sn-glycerol-3-phosphate acyltransferase [Oscillospiraceae bacterium]|nr:1-acyl-sn-glycerol-3-phosphate acyltransferase [Oscillospiraceae bacterium]
MSTVYRIYYNILFVIYHFIYRMRVLHADRVPEGPMLVCGNHTSLSDPIIISLALGKKTFVRYMAKIELMRIPLLGALLRAIGTFGVDRGNSDITAVRTAMRILKDGGTVGIFPEGKRVSEEEKASAKTGAIMLASKTGAKILPVYVPRKRRLFGRLNVVIGEPYTVERTHGGAETYAPIAGELLEKINMLKEESGE